jgi:hypothetical protein
MHSHAGMLEKPALLRDFYVQAHQNQLQFRFATDRHTIQAPLELVALFYKRLYGMERLDAQLVAPKETALAAELIEQYGLAGARDLIEFALEQALCHEDLRSGAHVPGRVGSDPRAASAGTGAAAPTVA